MMTTSLPSPFAGELPAKLCVFLRQHLDHDSSASVQRSWVEFVELATPSRKPVVTFIDKVLAGEPQSRQVTSEVEGTVDTERLLEEAFQNLLGVWPIPRQGLRQDLTTLGYRMTWNQAVDSTITPVFLESVNETTRIDT